LENDAGEVEKKIMHKNDYFNVTPPKKHRVIALTDIILQEVSTPEVNDVIRIEDDTHRKDGLITGEHQTPAILILAAGKGVRLKTNTTHKNKALVPINNKAILSHIIDKFPVTHDIIIAVGYKGESIKEYCSLVHPDRKIQYVDIENWESNGPGNSTLKCKSYLQRPFYVTTVDCLIADSIPALDGNWVGVYPTGMPEKYSTVKVSDTKTVIDFKNKSLDGYDLAFIGLSAILNYDIFWDELEKTNKTESELISAWYNTSAYPTLKIKELKWYDTGNLDDLETAKEHFNDVPISLHKETGEVTYAIDKKILKFSPDPLITTNRILRGTSIKKYIPTGFVGTKHFIAYDWEPGNTLYQYNSLSIFNKFLKFYDTEIIAHSEKIGRKDPVLIKKFYQDKTHDRIKLFKSLRGDQLFTTSHIINNTPIPSLNSLLSKIDFSIFENDPFYSNFHGDLQFDNILYNSDSDTFKYIDWRESFAGCVDDGDIYYDLAKLYGGCLLPYDVLKSKKIQLTQGTSTVSYSYYISNALLDFTKVYTDWITSNNYDLYKVKLLTGIIYINMAPLHNEFDGTLLLYKAAELLNETLNQ
jgi:dTDP-glucose pyrophosphorylase